MNWWRCLLSGVWLAGSMAATGQVARTDPRVGYLYPAGISRGSTVTILAAGQNLRSMDGVRISGSGVEGKVIKSYRPLRNLDQDQRALFMWRVACRRAELNGTPPPPRPEPVQPNPSKKETPKSAPSQPEAGKPAPAKPESVSKDSSQSAPSPPAPAKDDLPKPGAAKPEPGKPDSTRPNPDGKPAPEVELPEHPLLDMLGQMDLRDVEHWVTVFQRFNRMQPSPQLGELVRIEIKVSPDAEPGMRELRLSGPPGLTNPVRFAIGTLPEAREYEPNEPGAEPKESPPPVIDLPCTFNGQIQSGDVDQFRFRARRGQNLVVRGEARGLIPYLADAVPGWFQMVMAVRGANGREVAYGDHFRFDPDPVLYCKIPEDGEYLLEVRDSIYRGREDFVYRVSIGELPFVTAEFPLGGKEGAPLTMAVRGWNLPLEQLRPDTSVGGPPIRVTHVSAKLAPSNDVPYAVDTLPEANESEPNDDAAHANTVAFPCVVNGRVAKAGDADVFRIEGKKGQELVVEVLARRLRSPLDSVVHVADESGHVLGWNDDSMEKDGQLHLGDGLLTHYADSRTRVKLPADGPVFVRIADTQMHGGPEYGYRLRLCELRPDFELRVTPSALNVPPGGHVPLRLHVLRNNGFDGEITLSLENAPPGFILSGARIPAGATQARVTLTTPPQAANGVYAPDLTGTASREGRIVTRKAVAADDMMQAFLWRHLVPTDNWLVCVTAGRGRRPAVALDTPVPVRVPMGGAAEVRVKVPKWIVDRGMDLELSEAPPGISIASVRTLPDGAAFDLTADEKTVKAGFETNLIVDALAKAPAGKKPGGAQGQARVPVASLPAIPIIVVPSNKP